MTRKTEATITVILNFFWLGILLFSSFGFSFSSVLGRPLTAAVTLSAIIVQVLLIRRHLRRESSSMSQEQIRAWEAVRAKGKHHYILRGLIYIALGMALSIILCQLPYWFGKSTVSIFEIPSVFIVYPIMLVGAYFIRLKAWDFHEENYRASAQ
jgi:hypothetical protein